MKKKLYAFSGVFLIALVIAGLWATKATNLTSVEQTLGSQETTLVEKMSVRQMTAQSKMIVEGTVLNTQSQWFGRNLYTLAKVAVTDQIKGGASTVTVVTPGGIAAKGKFHVAAIVPDAPKLFATERAILFLQPYEGKEISDGHVVVGFSQGVFRIAQDSQGNEMVAPGLANAGVQKGVGLARGPRQALRLAEFKEMVRAYLKQ